MSDLVLACTAWIDAIRRDCYAPTDQLIVHAVRDARFTNVLVANPFRSGPVLTARRLLGQGEPPLPAGPGTRLQYTPVRLRRHDPRGREGLAAAHRAYGERLARMADRLGMRRPAVITSDPFTAAFADFDSAGPVTYYAFDDWAAHPAFARWRDVYPSAYALIRERGLRVAAVSEVLLSRIAPRGRHACVPNGVDPREWRSRPCSPSWFFELARPRLLYVGTLDQRLDIDAIRAVARRFAGSVALVGPLANRAHLHPLSECPRVHVIPPVSRSELIALVHAADVCIMPHLRTALTEAMSPLKVYEYLAAGRPVAASDLPPVRELADRIELAEDGSEFPDAVARALERGPMPEHERLEFVHRNSWQRRLDQLLDLACGAPV